MKILHTADIHIQQVGDARWQALQSILQLARKNRVDVVVISGDLFDAAYHAEQVRGEIRSVFQAFDGTILLLPGNHDYSAFQDGYFWGSNVHVFLNAEEPLVMNDIYFWGVPFLQVTEEALVTLITKLNAIAQHQAPRATHVLLFHGELLDISGNPASYGDDLEHYYMPVQLATFRGKIWQYILAGHFHTTFHALQFEKNKYFVYPGSPISITRREINPRRVNLFRVQSHPREHLLETAYYHPLHMALTPEDTWQTVVQRLEERINSLSPYAIPLLTLTGTFDSANLQRSESELVNALAEKFPRCHIQEFRARDIHHLVSDEVFQMLKQKIDRRTSLTPEQRREVIDFLMQVMTEQTR